MSLFIALLYQIHKGTGNREQGRGNREQATSSYELQPLKGKRLKALEVF
jgi:hypothetical protein